MYKQKIKSILIILGCLLFIFNVFNLNSSLAQGTSDINFNIAQELVCDFNASIFDSETIYYNCEIDNNQILTRGWEFNMNNNTDEQYNLDYTNADNFTDLYETDNFDMLSYDSEDQMNTTNPTITQFEYDIERELINYDYEVNGNGYFYGIYSFTDDANGGNPAKWDIVETGGTVNVIASVGTHSKILEMDDTSAVNLINAYNSFTHRVENGTIEFWFRVTDKALSNVCDIRYAGVSRISFGIYNNQFYYYSGGYNFITAANNNQWYHLRIDFECGSNGYLGLASDTFFITIDGIQYGAYNFAAVSEYMDDFGFRTANADILTFYADGIGYNWNVQYDIGYNNYDGFEYYGFTKDLYQLHFNETTNIDYELIFHFSIEQYQDIVVTYPILFITLDNDDNQTIFEYRVHVNPSDTNIYSLYYYDDIGIELLVTNFSLNDNMEMIFTPYNSALYPDNRYNLDIYLNDVLNYSQSLILTYDDNLLNNVGNLTYYIIENASITGTNKFHCDYIYAKSNDTYLHENRTSFIMFPYLMMDTSTGFYSSNKYISSELFFLHDIIGTYSFWLSNYNMFYNYPRDVDGEDYCVQSWCNYTTNEVKFRNLMPVAQMPTTYLQDGVNNGYRFTIKMFGNLIVDEFRLFYNVHLNSSTLDSRMLSLNNWDIDETSYAEDFFDTSIDFNNTYLYQLDNTFDYPNGAERYSIYADWYYRSYFYVENDVLYINYNVVNNTLEYIDLGFEFLPTNYFYTTNYSLTYEYYKRGAMTGYNILSYITRYSTNTLQNYYYYHEELQYFSQNEYLDELRFFLSDRDNDALSNTTTNFFAIKNINFVITEGIAISILTGTLIDMFIPIFIILTPSLAISLKTDKKLFIPLFMIFTIVCAILEIIPLWIFFVIFISLSTYLFVNREGKQNDF